MDEKKTRELAERFLRWAMTLPTDREWGDEELIADIERLIRDAIE